MACMAEYEVVGDGLLLVSTAFGDASVELGDIPELSAA